MCDVPSLAAFCSESIECFPGTASRFFLKLLVTIPVAPVITSVIVHFRLHIRFISMPEILYFNFIIIIIITAIELSHSGSSPYTSTDKTNKNKYT